MEKYLFIAEKPSLMRDVQACYKKHKQEVIDKVGYIDFIALAGHVCRVGEPDSYDKWHKQPWATVDYPMVPEAWIVEPINDKKKQEILKKIKDMEKDYDGIIVGTDSDVEGYGIYYLLEEYLGLKDKKALRFIEHSLTDKEILSQLLCMTDFHTDDVHRRFVQSFLARSRADWLYGMNATRLMSVKQDELMAIGRVKTVTIKIVHDNSMAIENFKSRKYYQVEADYGSFTSSLLDEEGTVAQFDDKSKISKYPLDGIIKSKECKKVEEHAPKLYDLAAIQVEAGQKYSLSPNQVLNLVQSLYETHKLLSYPRTQCRYVSKEKSAEFKMMLSHLTVFDDLKPYVDNITDSDIETVRNDKQVVNDKEVQKESHDAILPTSERPNLERLTEDEKKILKMVYVRLLAQFLPKAVDDKTRLLIEHGDGTFLANGKITLNQGWRVLYKESHDKSIPDLNEGDKITAKKIDPVEKNTTPPKRLTQATLLDAMKNVARQIEDKELKKSLQDSKGIGTPATRASIIKDILNRNYVEEKKNGLYITNLGKQYVNAVKELDIASPVFAAILDTEIKKIQRGEAVYDDVYGKIIDGLVNMCRQIQGMEGACHKLDIPCPVCGGELKNGRFKYECQNCDFSVSKNICGKKIDISLLKTIASGEKTPILKFKKGEESFEARLVLSDGKVKFCSAIPDTNCKCPVCGEKLSAGKWYYSCPNEDFKIQRVVCEKTIDEKMLEQLLDGKATRTYTFKKKDGTSFKAKLKLQGGELKFDSSLGISCPLCGNDSVRINKGGAFCDCGLKLFRNIAKHSLTDDELKLLLKGKKTAMIDDFVGGSGSTFSARVFLVDGQTKFEFEKK